MPGVTNHIKTDSEGFVKYISIIHPVDGEYFLIQQIVKDDGFIDYYTNEVKEEMIGKNNGWKVEIKEEG